MVKLARVSETWRIRARTSRSACHRTLAAAGLGAEAMVQASTAMLAAACGAAHAAVAGIEIDDELPTARLLFEVLVPQEALSLEQAAIITRAQGLARSYAETTAPVPEEMVRRVLADAEELVAWAEGV
jgi:hypothetical protein